MFWGDLLCAYKKVAIARWKNHELIGRNSLTKCFHLLLSHNSFKCPRADQGVMSDLEPADEPIDIEALLGSIDQLRSAIVRAAPGLQENHHNYVRVSAIEPLIARAIGYARSMK